MCRPDVADPMLLAPATISSVNVTATAVWAVA
jgi:hypothetical protein